MSYSFDNIAGNLTAPSRSPLFGSSERAPSLTGKQAISIPLAKLEDPVDVYFGNSNKKSASTAKKRRQRKKPVPLKGEDIKPEPKPDVNQNPTDKAAGTGNFGDSGDSLSPATEASDQAKASSNAPESASATPKAETEPSSAEKPAEAKQTENPNETNQTEPTEETKESKKTDKPKKKTSFWSAVKSLVVTGLGIGLVALPIVIFPIAATAGVFALVKALIASIPFIIAKDYLDDYVSKNHDDVTNLSDVKKVREILDEKMAGFVEKTMKKVPWIETETKANWSKKIMGIYETHISKILEAWEGDMHFSSLFKDVPHKLKNADGMLGKAEILVTTVGMILKLAFLTAGRQRLIKGAARGGVWGALLGGVLVIYNYFFKDQADRFEAELKTKSPNNTSSSNENPSDKNQTTTASAAA